MARTLEDRRQAVRDLLSKRAVLLLVDDVDLGEAAALTFLGDLPGRSRALVAGRRRLPSEVRALMPEPLAPEAVRELLLAEAERQGAPELGRALGEPVEGLRTAARHPLLAGWALGQARRRQTRGRGRERVAPGRGRGVRGEVCPARCRP